MMLKQLQTLFVPVQCCRYCDGVGFFDLREPCDEREEDLVYCPHCDGTGEDPPCPKRESSCTR